jgi:predicted enzyme involved in methoxymalonyl-ACP biosynthesis
MEWRVIDAPDSMCLSLKKDSMLLLGILDDVGSDGVYRIRVTTKSSGTKYKVCAVASKDLLKKGLSCLSKVIHI